jgi:hypothetical protein
MRCARCDRLAVPQAVGLSPKGLVVFGWCVQCLEETGCQRIVVASRARPRSTRVELERAEPRVVLRRPRSLESPKPRRPVTPLGDRRRLVGAVSLVLALWGMALLAVGLVYRFVQEPRVPSPLGNGTPALLIGGGGTTAVVGLTLWLLTLGTDLVKSRPTLRLIQVLGVLVAVVILFAGVVAHSPRRDPVVVAVASVSLAVSVVARWMEKRLVPVRNRP